MALSDSHARRLNEVLVSQNINTAELKCENPFNAEFSKTPRGRLIQTIIEGSSPQLAAELRDQAGGSTSLAYAAFQATPGADPSQLTGELLNEYRRRNPEAVQRQEDSEEARILKKLDSLTDQSRRRREGDAEIDRQRAKAKAEAEARAASYQRHVEQQARIQARQQQDQRMYGGAI